VQPTGIEVPVHYTSIEGFDVLGPWYRIHLIGWATLAMSIANTVLSMISFQRSRITSFILLSGSFVVALFGLVIANAFAAII
jgi:hypothetical protein